MLTKKTFLSFLLFFLFLFALILPIVNSDICGYVGNVTKDHIAFGVNLRYSKAIRIDGTDNFLFGMDYNNDRLRLYSYPVYSNNGTFGSQLDYKERPATYGHSGMDLCYAGNDIYLTCGSASATSWYPLIYSHKVLSNGNITTIGSLVLPTYLMQLGSYIDEVDILTLDNDVSIVIHPYTSQGTYSYGRMTTFTVDSNGVFSSILDQICFNNSALFSKMIALDSNTVAVMYKDNENEGWIKTYDIDPDGDIGDADDHYNSVWNFDDTCIDRSFNLYHVYDNVYVLIYHDGTNFLAKSFIMFNSGTIIKSFIDSMVIDATGAGAYPSFYRSSDGIMGIACSGAGSDGHIKTFNISNVGYMDSAIIDQLEYYDGNLNNFPSLIYVDDDCFLVGGSSEVSNTDFYTVFIECAGEEEDEEEDEEDYDTEAGCIGSLSTANAVDFNPTTNGGCLEHTFHVKLNAIISRVELLITDDMYDAYPNVEYYYLCVNDYDCGNPSIEEHSSGYYLLTWDNLQIVLEDEYPVFQWRYYPPLAGSWIIPYTDDDVDNDGITQLGFHNCWDCACDNDFDYIVNPFPMLFSKDPLYRFCYESGEIVLPEYDDYIDVHSVNNDEIFYENELVVIDYWISDFTYDNYIQIWKDGTQYTDNGFGGEGRKISGGSYSGVETFTPTEAGNYDIALRRNSVNLSYDNITVLTALQEDFVIYTSPNPSIVDKDFTVSYEYNHLTKDGAIGYGESLSLEDIEIVSYINTTGSKIYGNFTYSHSETGLYYWFLLIEISSNRYQVSQDGIHTHYVKDQFDTNYLEIRYENLDLAFRKGFASRNTQQFNGHHSKLGSTVYVLLNNQIIEDVSLDQNFRFLKTMSKTGVYTARLVVYTENGYIDLCDSVSFTVSDTTGADEEAGDALMNIVNSLKDWEKAIWGTIIIMFFLFLPILLQVWLQHWLGWWKNKSVFNVPPLVYAISCGVGISITIAFGLIALWVPFFIIIIAIVLTVLIYFRGSK